MQSGAGGVRLVCRGRLNAMLGQHCLRVSGLGGVGALGGSER